MRVQTLHLTRRRQKSARPARPARGAHPRPVPAALEADERSRKSGGPLDSALYGCSCGFQFSAAVSTSVSCPHCGTLQAW